MKQILFETKVPTEKILKQLSKLNVECMSIVDVVYEENEFDLPQLVEEKKGKKNVKNA